MENTLFDTARYRHSIGKWWVSILLGVLFLIVGIIVFFRPGDSYLALSILFGIVVVLSGLFEIYLGSNGAPGSGRGWYIAGGIVEIVLGIWMLSTPTLLLSVLPFVLGFWLLLRGFTSIGTASDMAEYGIRGTGWTMLFAILVIICAFFLLFHPIIGVGVVVVWLGLSLIFAGIDLIVHGAHMRRLHGGQDPAPRTTAPHATADNARNGSLRNGNGNSNGNGYGNGNARNTTRR